jgi:uncharacterized membrane protein YdbT with pleckstrin-like domain
MSENTIWKGSSSNWKNFNSLAILIVSVPVCVWLNVSLAWSPYIYLVAGAAALWALVQWAVVRSTVYEVTNERLVITRGIFTRVTDTLELYRVRDIQIVQPLLLRFLNLHNIAIITTDSTTPEAVLDFIPTSAGLGDQFRKAVEACREAKRVRAFDVVSEGDAGSDGMVS